MKVQGDIGYREIEFNGSQTITSSIYKKNTVSSTRYTWTNLIPKNLFEQFQRSANIWFLAISVLQIIEVDNDPTYSWTTIVPLILLLVFTFLKDAYNDHYRYQQDEYFNHKEYLVWEETGWKALRSENILVGQLIELRDTEISPADLVLLATSSEDRTVFVDAFGIIGETDLLLKAPIDETEEYMCSLDLYGLEGKAKISPPSSDINSFSGNIRLAKDIKASQVTIKNFIPKGGVIKGAEVIFGLVVYTSDDCTMLHSIKKPRKKISRLERTVNVWVIEILSFYFLLVTFSILALFLLSKDPHDDLEYDVFESLYAFLLLYNNVVPISLFVVMDLSRMLEVFFIEHSMKKEVDFKTGDVNEDMGQISYVVADKTGTITECKFQITYMIAKNTLYFEEDNPNETLRTFKSEEHEMIPIHNKEENENIFFLGGRSSGSGDLEDYRQYPKVSFDKMKETALKGENSHERRLVTALAIANSVIASDGEYISYSIDELAMVETAEKLGFKLKNHTQNECEIKINNSIIENYEILGENQYDPLTDKAEIILRSVQSGITTFYMRSGIEALENNLYNPAGNEKSTLLNNEAIFSASGLKTYILSYKNLTEDETEDFIRKYKQFSNEKFNTKNKINNLFKEFEYSLHILAVLGSQELVLPETIQTLRCLKQASIKVWIVSGDNQQNTISTCKLSKLFNEKASTIKLNEITNTLQCEKILIRVIEEHINLENQQPFFRSATIRTSLLTINPFSGTPEKSPELLPNETREIATVRYSESSNNAEVALSNHPLLQEYSKAEMELGPVLNRPFVASEVLINLSIDQTTFKTALEDEDCRKLLTCLLFACNAVCFSGMKPIDKANVVKLLKENLSFKPVVLAVGDDNSNIPMIQEAHVGVGVSRSKDSEVVNYGELGIKHFNQLYDILLVHGHWNYTRMARTVLLFLYKNFILIVFEFFYIFLNDYTGATLVHTNLLLGYNLFFTTLPVLWLAVFDQDLPPNSEKIPKLYYEGLINSRFSVGQLVEFSGLAVVHGLIIGIFLIWGMPMVLNEDGLTESLDFIGQVVFLTGVLVVLYEVYLETHSLNMWFFVSVLLSLLILMIYCVIINFSDFGDTDLLGVGDMIAESPLSFFNVFLVALLCICASHALVYLKLSFRSSSIAAVHDEHPKKFNRLKEFSENLERVYKFSGSWKINSYSTDEYEINKYSLRFESSSIEKKYGIEYIHLNIKLFKPILLLIWILLVLWTIYEAVLAEAEFSFTLLRIFMSIAFSVVVFVVYLDIFLTYYKEISVFVIGVALTIKFATEVSFSFISILATACIPALTYILFNIDFLWISFLNIYSLLLFLISLGVYFAQQNEEAELIGLEISSIIVLEIGIILTSAMIGYIIDKQQRLEYKLLTEIENSVMKNAAILGFLLPSFVRKRVKEGVRYISEDQGIVTVLFCDICDFDELCNEYSPSELMDFLNMLFLKFDLLCEYLGVIKIETVGKTYMACTGLRDSEAELDFKLKEIPEARRAVEMALNMIEIVQTIKLKNGKSLSVKIGINSGDVTAGVVGRHKPQFSLVGDTVNTASRMCSTIEGCNKIEIHTNTRNMINDTKGLILEAHRVEPKGKGVMDTFLVYESEERFQEVEETGISSTFGIPGNESMLGSGLAQSTQPSDHPRCRSSRGEMEKKKEEIVQKLKIFNFSLKETPEQEAFRLYKLDENYWVIKVGQRIGITVYFALCTIELVGFFIHENWVDKYLLITGGIVALFLVLPHIFLEKLLKKFFYSTLFLLVIAALISQEIGFVVSDSEKSGDLPALYVLFTILIASHNSGININHVIISQAIILIPWFACSFASKDTTLHIANGVILFGFSSLNFSAVYTRERTILKYYNQSIIYRQEIEKTQGLLINMMPAWVLDELLNDREITDKFSYVTMLYADIVGFTAWSSGKMPNEVVNMLSLLFTRFDELCETHNVYKVHTIGDCYVVMSIVEKEDRNYLRECLNVLKFAIDMIEVIERVNGEFKAELNMRIGIHIGDVIGGVTGTNIVRYDIYGPDVLIANKMESGGSPGRINVSDTTKEFLESNLEEKFEFEFNAEILAKSINRCHDSYFFIPNEKIFDIEI